MDSRDVLILGGVGLAGYLGWRWWQRTQAAPRPSTDGAATSTMTRAAALATQAGATLLGGLRSGTAPLAAGRPPGFFSSSSYVLQSAAKSASNALALNARPQPVAAAPNTNYFTVTGVQQPRGSVAGGAVINLR